MSKIITQHIFPPIPDRSHDWMAYLDDTDGDGPQGWGTTEAEAIADLKEQEDADFTEDLAWLKTM